MHQSRNNVQNFMHFVWTTRNREALFTPELERAVHRCIVDQTRQLECPILAIGGMPDHVHLLLQVSPKNGVSHVIKQIKGVSSAFARDLGRDAAYFRWQEGYGGFSLTRSHLERVQKYVCNQKERHATGRLWPAFERFDDE